MRSPALGQPGGLGKRGGGGRKAGRAGGGPRLHAQAVPPDDARHWKPGKFIAFLQVHPNTGCHYPLYHSLSYQLS